MLLSGGKTCGRRGVDDDTAQAKNYLILNVVDVASSQEGNQMEGRFRFLELNEKKRLEKETLHKKYCNILRKI